MKIIFFNYLIIIIYLISSSVSYSIERPEIKNLIVHKDKKKIENIEFIKSEGEKVSLNNFKSNPLIINFWATWCAPCKKELPDLNLLDQKLEKYKIDVLTISIDKKNIKDQIKFLSKNGASDLTHFFDKKMNIFKAMNLRGVPTTLLVDKTGLVVSKHEGILKWSEDVIVKEIVHLLN